MYFYNNKGIWMPFFLLINILTSTPLLAIDNPDAPDYLASFKNEAERHELQIANETSATGMAEADSRYEKFLDAQLNTTYKQLRDHLTDAQKDQLKNSQQAWLHFRDAEIKLIFGNWTPENFGSSSAISRRAYVAAITRARVEQLLIYLKNY